MPSSLSCSLVASILLFAGLESAAFAHAHLLEAAPAVGSLAAPPPSELRLKFTQDLVIGSSTVTITGPEKKVVEAGSLTRPDEATLVLPLRGPLLPGNYEVNWHVLCVDGQETEGSYRFGVTK
jgi:methionine-rich copper-binding protein CopC